MTKELEIALYDFRNSFKYVWICHFMYDPVLGLFKIIVSVELCPIYQKKSKTKGQLHTERMS